ncbi:MAG: 2-keto-3-deoxygluconate permease [Pirellulales bacterium]|nr:2-keto-3-deoxygluconate permease [Pirellulales bacterium]
MRTHPAYWDLAQKAEASHLQNRSPAGLADEDVSRARLYSYALRRHTIDQAHLAPIQALLKSLGTTPTAEGHYEFFRIGGFTTALFKTGALTLIALFLFCAGAQMNLHIGRRAIKKGAIITATKFATAVAVGWGFGAMFDPFNGPLGLSTVAIIAAMENSNGGMYVALTGQYGNRSDVGAVGVLSLNDGPLFTMIGLGILGSSFPVIAFVAVLLPILLGMLLGSLDGEIRTFLRQGQELLIPFFAFALGANMNFAAFNSGLVAVGGVVLGTATVILTSITAIACLKIFGERSQICGVAEASTAGTPLAIAVAAETAAEAGDMTSELALKYNQVYETATAQIGISTLTTAILCPVAVIFWDRYQRSKGIDGREED